MPLVLTLRLGESLYVNESKFTLTRILSEKLVQIERTKDKTVFDITTDEGAEIEDDVVVTLGDRMTTKAARLAIDAPKSKLILSEEKYLKSNPG